MRHAVRSRRLGRSRSERAALVRSLAQALIRYERIQTTLPKAKEAQRASEHLISQAKSGTLAARRRVEAWLQDPGVTRTLFTEVAPRFQRRNGGYTRIVQTGHRRGDGATMAILEFVERRPEALKKAAPPPKPPEPAKTPAPPKKKAGFLGGLRKFFRRDRPSEE